MNPITVYKAYMGLFYSRNYKDSEILNNIGITEDEAYDILNNFWNYNFGKKLEDNNDNREKLYNFANCLFKYNLLNDHIRTSLDDFINCESSPDIVDYLGSIIEIIEDQFSSINGIDTSRIKKPAYLSSENLISYFVDFLSYIDSSEEYLEIFENMVDEGRIFFLDLVSEESKQQLFKQLDIDDKNYDNFFWHANNYGGYIFLTRNNDINDFKALAHEFAHYISYIKSNGKKVSNILSEFPALFYEMLSCNFLLNKGYTSEDIEGTILDRTNYIYEQSEFMANINCYLKLFMECNEKITYEADIEMRQKQLQNFITRIGKNKYKSLSDREKRDLSPKKLAKSFSDFANLYLGLQPSLISNTYPYFIGNYFACKYIKKCAKDSKTLDMMKYITDNLCSVKFDELLNDSLEINDDVEKVKVKKDNKKRFS